MDTYRADQDETCTARYKSLIVITNTKICMVSWLPVMYVLQQALQTGVKFVTGRSMAITTSYSARRVGTFVLAEHFTVLFIIQHNTLVNRHAVALYWAAF